MKPGLAYVNSWLMIDGVTEVGFYIYDTTVLVPDDADVSLIQVKTSGNPMTVSVIDNSRDKFTPIKSKQCRIEIVTEVGITRTTFASGPDSRWLLVCVLGAETIFRGFVTIADIQQDFLPNPQILVLTAIDGLGLLRDIPLTDFTGTNPKGKHKISSFLAWALGKTGHSLGIKVVNNIRHGSGLITEPTGGVNFHASGEIRLQDSYEWFPYIGQHITVTGSASNNSTFTVTGVIVSAGTVFITVAESVTGEFPLTGVTLTDASGGHFYDSMYLEAKTFENKIGISENCFSVLEKILGEYCFLTQYKGNWWIRNVDEFDGTDVYLGHFDSAGVYSGLDAPTTYNHVLTGGPGGTRVTADMLALGDREHGLLKETFNYDTPLEVPCNIDFERGDVVIDDSNQNEIKYEIDCWDELWSNTSTDDPQTTGIYIQKSFINGYEKSRKLVLEANAPRFTFIMSEEIPVTARDKFILSVDRRLSATDSPAGLRDNHVQVRLYANDGTFYTHESPTSVSTTRQWVATDSTFRTNQKWFSIEVDPTFDLRESASLFDGESAEIPKAGNLRILLYRSSLYGDVMDTYFDSCQFEYLGCVNGSFRILSGQYQKISRAGGYLAAREKQVYISDSPKPLFKGAMFTQFGGFYSLSNRFYAHNVFPTGLSGPGFTHPYGEMQVRTVWNQYRNPNSIFTVTCVGIGANWPDLIHKYTISLSDPSCTNRYFVCTGFEQNWKTGSMRMTLVEVYNTIRGKNYDDDREFKYIAE